MPTEKGEIFGLMLRSITNKADAEGEVLKPKLLGRLF